MFRVLVTGVLVMALVVGAFWWLFQKARGGRGGPDEAAYAVPVPPSPEPVRLVIPRGTDWFSMNWGILLVLVGLGLFGNPKALWTAWLAVPAGIGAIGIGASLIAMGWPEPDGTLTAGPSGLHREVGGQGQDLPWDRVRALHLESRRYGPRNQYTQQRWVVVDDRGGYFLRLDVPLAPFDEWARLRQSIEAWSGRRWTFGAAPPEVTADPGSASSRP